MKKLLIVIGLILLAGAGFIYEGINAAEKSEKTDVVFSKTSISAEKMADLEKKHPSKNLSHGKLNFDCVACHGDFKDTKEIIPPTKDQCLACHGDYKKVAERTSYLDKNEVNPHDGFHHKDRLDCADCHKEHKPSVNYCANCHDTKVWMRKTP